LVEQIRGVRRLEKDNWSNHFTWVKAHDNMGNEIADQLAKKAASRRDGETAYSRIPKSALVKVTQKKVNYTGNKNGMFQPKGKQQNHSFQT
jgi:ribonuclease HI